METSSDLSAVSGCKIYDVLSEAIKAGASDVHVHSGSPPLLRIGGQLETSSFPVVSAGDTAQLARGMMNERRWADFEVRRDADFAYDVPSLGRFRVNVHYQRNSIALSIRIVPRSIRTLEELFLPLAVERLTQFTRGLVLVTGPTGCGKSTTLAALIDAINRRDRGHIITLEDPIEHEFKSNLCAIEQREVGVDVPDFASGLRHVLRQDPDVILLGEMRDLETTRAAITAAETGHLVLSTLHTVNAPQTVERIIDIYPAAEQDHVRGMLANTLQAVVSQTLLRRWDEPGMVPAVELMFCTPAVRNCIRENRIFELPNVIETSRAQGMQTLDSAIRQLHINGYVSREEALVHAVSPDKLDRQLAAA